MEALRRVRLILTKEEVGDHAVQEKHGESAMRKVQLLRMTEEAEGEYKVLGSHKVLAMLADDIEQLHQGDFEGRF